jgi:fluoroquinolone resistance protein
MADRSTGNPRPPTTSTFDAAAWGEAPLSGSHHDAVLFDGVDLSDVVVRGALFADCTFREVRFNASRLIDTAFTNCTFVHCSFFDVAFTTCKLVGSQFDRCDHKLMAVEGGDWSLVGLPGADLAEATFRTVRMREADLSGARFDGATVRDVDLSGARLHRASFHGSDLRGSDLSSLDPLNVDIVGAKIDIEQAAAIAEALGLRVG